MRTLLLKQGESHTILQTPNSFWRRGSVTIEAAMGMAAIIVVLGIIVGGLSAAAAQIAAVEASSNAARFAARGESAHSIEQKLSSGTKKVSVHIAEVHSAGHPALEITVTVGNRIREGRATAIALKEEAIQGAIDDDPK